MCGHALLLNVVWQNKVFYGPLPGIKERHLAKKTMRNEHDIVARGGCRLLSRVVWCFLSLFCSVFLSLLVLSFFLFFLIFFFFFFPFLSIFLCFVPLLFLLFLSCLVVFFSFLFFVCSFFPTCQVRVFRFYQSCMPAPPRTLNRERQIPVDTAGPQRRAPDVR